MSAQDNFYLQLEEPFKGCLLAMRTFILAQDEHITAEWKYGMPFFCYKGKMFCYLWVHKKMNQPYIGFVEGKQLEHPKLLQEKRSRMKILLLDAEKDLPVRELKQLLGKAIRLYTSGVVRN